MKRVSTRRQGTACAVGNTVRGVLAEYLVDTPGVADSTRTDTPIVACPNVPV